MLKLSVRSRAFLLCLASPATCNAARWTVLVNLALLCERPRKAEADAELQANRGKWADVFRPWPADRTPSSTSGRCTTEPLERWQIDLPMAPPKDRG
jgi:hypothetical protein